VFNPDDTEWMELDDGSDDLPVECKEVALNRHARRLPDERDAKREEMWAKEQMKSRSFASNARGGGNAGVTGHGGAGGSRMGRQLEQLAANANGKSGGFGKKSSLSALFGQKTKGFSSR